MVAKERAADLRRCGDELRQVSVPVASSPGKPGSAGNDKRNRSLRPQPGRRGLAMQTRIATMGLVAAVLAASPRLGLAQGAAFCLKTAAGARSTAATKR